MKNWMLFFAVGLLTVPLLAADSSFPGIETIVTRVPANVSDLGVASASDADLVIWTSAQHLYGARVARTGDLIDATPFEIAPVAYYPSVASNGTRFVVMWSSGNSGIVSFDARVIGANGAPGPIMKLVTNADAISRSQVAFGAGSFAVAWVDDTPFIAEEGIAPQGQISFLTIDGETLMVRTSPFAIGVEMGEWVDYTGFHSWYWTYAPPTILPTDRGLSALWYDATLKAPPGCGGIPESGCSGSAWDYELKHSELVDSGSGYVMTATSPTLYTIRATDLYSTLTVRPFTLLSLKASSVLWTTDDFPPARGGDTIRRLAADAGTLLQPGPGDVMFTSSLGSIRTFGAAATERSFWIAWIDRMRDWEPPQPARLFIEQVSPTGEKSTYASLPSAASLAVGSGLNRVAIAAFVFDGTGRIVLETLSEPESEPVPSRNRAIRR